eukprot:s2105_g14.t1
MVAPPKAEAAANTEVRAEQRYPVVDRPDEHSWGDRAAGPEQEVQATTAEEPVRRGPSVAVIGTAIRVLVSATEDDLMDSLETVRLTTAEEPVRRGPSVAVIGTAIRVLVSATEDDLMDSLETVRLRARARLASLFAQSVAEGHSAYDAAPASGADAFYEQEALVSALFDEKAVDDAIQVLSDSEGPPDATFSLPTGAGARSVRGRRAAEDSDGQEPSDKAAGGVFNSPVSGSTGQANHHATAERPVSRGTNQAAGCLAVVYHYKTSVFPDGPVSYQVDDYGH